MVGTGLASERDARAYCRTRVVKNSSDDCLAQGPSLYWQNQCVGYAVNKAASKKANLATARQIIDDSYSPWTATNATCTPGIKPIELDPTDVSTVGYDTTGGANANIVVFRDTSWPYDDPGNPLALTTVSYDKTTGQILDADIEVNTADASVTAASPLPVNSYDLQSIITHEVGHFLGLAHSDTDGATMRAQYARGDISIRTLSADDEQGICAIYPSNDTRVTDDTGGASPKTLTAGACSTASVVLNPPAPASSSGGCSVARPGLLGLDHARQEPRCAGAAIAALLMAWGARRRRPRPRANSRRL